jgi:pectate lyase
MPRGGVALLVASTALLAGCTPAETQQQSRVWTTANSNDGFASCPADTVITGGGYEIKEEDRAAGRVPLVTASRPERNGWRVACVDSNGANSLACRAWAVCASVLAR